MTCLHELVGDSATQDLWMKGVMSAEAVEGAVGLLHAKCDY